MNRLGGGLGLVSLRSKQICHIRFDSQETMFVFFFFCRWNIFCIAFLYTLGENIYSVRCKVQEDSLDSIQENDKMVRNIPKSLQFN